MARKKKEETPKQEEYIEPKAKRFSISQEQKNRIIFISGLALIVFAAFTLVSLLSYLFTWQQDQSLLHQEQMLSTDVEVSNLAGKGGFRWAYFLFQKCFGFGSFGFVFLFATVALRMLNRFEIRGAIRTTILTFSGALIASAILGLISVILGTESAFGGGMGGECGSMIGVWMINLTGELIALLILIVLAIIWLIFVSKGFAMWITNLGAERQQRAKERRERLEREAKEKAQAEAIAKAEALAKAEAEAAEAAEAQTAPSVDTDADDADADIAADADVAAQPDTDVAADTAADTADTADTADAADATDTADAEGIDIDLARRMCGQLAADATEAGDAESQQDAQPGSDVNVEVEQFEGFDVTDVKELPRINMRDELPNFKFPSLVLLDDYAEYQHDITEEEQEINKQKVLKALEIYHIAVSDIKVIQGPTVTLYKIYIAPGVRINLIKNLEAELAMALQAEKGVRVVALPDSVGIEVPNDTPSTVPLKAMLDADAFRNSKAELPVAIGYTISKKVRTFDLADAPHLLVAGATKQGKSVGLNVIISSLLYSKHPSELKLVFIDPKMVEFSAYKNLYKHYLAVLPTACNDEDEKEKSIITDQKGASDVLKSLCIEMDDRYSLLKKAGVNNVKLYNEKYKDRLLLPTDGHKFMPYIVTVIDEFADLTMAQGMGGDTRKTAVSLKEAIIRLAQKGRAAGIHVILATQRPEASVVSGLIKSNCPMKIAFKVSNGIDSKVIIDGPGAEKLIGRGDMLLCSGVDKERVQCAMVSMAEIEKITEYIGNQTTHRACYTTPYYLPLPPVEGDGGSSAEVDMTKLDDHFEEAARMIVLNQKGSTSDLQRRLGLGYARAGKLMDQLEAAGIVGPQTGSKPREVLVQDFSELDSILEAFLK